MRLGIGEELAGVAPFFCSADDADVSGQILTIDRGDKRG
jgi:NAD(P)-dependent dehydrogenase (short-subunit alcohol dehydrogenase family)